MSWMRDPEFWRDVTKNVLTFSITGLLAFTVAVLAGYVREPDTRLYVIAPAILVLWLALNLFALERIKRKWGPEGILFFGFVIAVLALVASVLNLFFPALNLPFP